MMTRKDYVKTARILCEFGGRDTVRAVDFDALVLEFAVMFGADNPNFNRQRFIAACNGM